MVLPKLERCFVRNTFLLSPNLTIISNRMRGLLTEIETFFSRLSIATIVVISQIIYLINSKTRPQYNIFGAWLRLTGGMIMMHMDEIRRINPVTRIYIDEIGRENWTNVFMYG